MTVVMRGHNMDSLGNYFIIVPVLLLMCSPEMVLSQMLFSILGLGVARDYLHYFLWLCEQQIIY